METRQHELTGNTKDRTQRLTHLRRALSNSNATVLAQERTQVSAFKELAAALRESVVAATDVTADQVPLDQIDDGIRRLEDQLQSVGDEAQLANIDLQYALQQQQQTLQLMSTVSKLINDTSMAVIRSIGG